jgi:hypothetical protein
MQAKQQVAPLQTNEVANIRRKIASFDVEQYNFREAFRGEAPFKYESERPYKKIDDVNQLMNNFRSFFFFIINLLIDFVHFSAILKFLAWSSA